MIRAIIIKIMFDTAIIVPGVKYGLRDGAVAATTCETSTESELVPPVEKLFGNLKK